MDAKSDGKDDAKSQSAAPTAGLNINADSEKVGN